ncbi:hypothetical protein HID58_093274 [Brassica napus]|uniref:RNase H type-1 domain-containing protein n=1 Tax=Brassica napus TaxID=3708 RepID=A0ABQ7XDS2_BRANA|nr:hypothetical protein HID58_093274 [Brassica napus]
MSSPAGSTFSKRRSVSSALVAEALALKAAITEAANRGIDSLRVFSDSKTLISLWSPRRITFGFKEHSSTFTIYPVLLALSVFVSSRVWEMLWLIFLLKQHYDL